MKTVAFDEDQIGPQVCKANLIASTSYILISKGVVVERVKGIEKVLQSGIISGLKGSVK
jgi:hypothetical protein